jgi:hypothetical protein
LRGLSDALRGRAVRALLLIPLAPIAFALGLMPRRWFEAPILPDPPPWPELPSGPYWIEGTFGWQD